MSETEIEFVDAPPLAGGVQARTKRERILEFVELCKANPGKWARYTRKDSTNAANGAGAYLRRKHGLQYVTRTEADGSWVWACWPADQNEVAS